MPKFGCPVDHKPLMNGGSSLTCTECGVAYPVVRGVPILINDANSVFHRTDFVSSEPYAGASGYDGAADTSTGMGRVYRRFVRSLAEAPVPGGGAYHLLHTTLGADPAKKKLVIGAGERQSAVNTVRADVAFATGIDCIRDAHDLPFENDSFDVVYVEAVLEQSATRSAVSPRSRGFSFLVVRS